MVKRKFKTKIRINQIKVKKLTAWDSSGILMPSFR